MEQSLGTALVVMIVAAILGAVIKDPKTKLKVFGGGAVLFMLYWIIKEGDLGQGASKGFFLYVALVLFPLSIVAGINRRINNKKNKQK